MPDWPSWLDVDDDDKDFSLFAIPTRGGRSDTLYVWTEPDENTADGNRNGQPTNLAVPSIGRIEGNATERHGRVPKGRRKEATRPLERVHSDSFGPVEADIEHNRY